VRFVTLLILALPPPVALPQLIQAEAPRDKDQPGAELAAVIGCVRTQPAKVIALELFENVRVRIHRGIVIPIDAACGIEDETAVCLDEPPPRHVARRRIGDAEQGGQFRREH
jgi:hypothetical protein